MKPSSDWTPILTSRLRVLFDEGISFSHIAAELSSKHELAVTRNSAIAKANCLGLRRDPPPKTGQTKRLNWTQVRRPRSDPSKNKKLSKILSAGRRIAGSPTQSESLPSTPDAERWLKHDFEIPKRRRKNIWTLGPRDCKYIVGDPATPNHFYCGARKLPTLPYCADHARRCFHPAKSRLDTV